MGFDDAFVRLRVGMQGYCSSYSATLEDNVHRGTETARIRPLERKSTTNNTIQLQPAENPASRTTASIPLPALRRNFPPIPPPLPSQPPPSATSSRVPAHHDRVFPYSTTKHTQLPTP